MDILIRLLMAVIGVLLGVLFQKVASWMRSVIPTKRLWRIVKPKELVVVAAYSCITKTRVYIRPATGIGQVVALAYVVESLNTGYGNLDLKNVYLSTDKLKLADELKLHERWLNDLLLLGSPKNNNITRDFLKKVCSVQPAVQDKKGDIYWGIMKDGRRIDEGEERFPKEAEEEENKKKGKIVHDYGLIVRARNPFNTSEKRSVVLFSGKHTYGTMAAAIYFVKNMQGDRHYKASKKENIVALIRTDVEDNFPVDIRMVEDKFYEW